MNKTKGSIEAEISKAITQWEKEYLGRGSLAVKTDILRDMIIVSLLRVLSQAEFRVSETKEGLIALKHLRSEIFETGVEQLKGIILDITGEETSSFHTDISTRTGERIMVFKLANDLEKKINANRD